MQLSIVVPVYAGQAYLVTLFEKISILKTQWYQNEMPLLVGELIIGKSSRPIHASLFRELTCSYYKKLLATT